MSSRITGWWALPGGARPAPSLRLFVPHLLPRLGREGRTLGMVMLVPVFLLPAVGSGGDIATLLVGAASFLMLCAATLALHAEERLAGSLASGLGLALASLFGPGILLLALLYLALTALRLALPSPSGLVDLLLGGLALMVVLDAAFILLWLERSPAFLLFGGLLGLFLTVEERHVPAGLGPREARLALSALLLGSYMALLVADPLLAPHAHTMASLSVPLLAAVLLRACRHAPAAGGADRPLILGLAAWALLMTVALEGLPGF
ncbi:hypothetical protein SH611_10835 [Geminicoccaceae bacterium 1502E]|nr:hypothetical protein [Geminicoccaceae bacterium 1502E]